MTNAQTEAREIETQAWCCDEWPEWLHKIVDETCEVADRLDMSAEQAHAYAVLAAKDEEMKGWKKTATEYASELHSLRSQLAEARKALERIEVRTRSVPSDTAGDDKRDKYHANSIARRALTGGKKDG